MGYELLTVKVSDAVTLEPISGATVTLNGLSQTTDVNGEVGFSVPDPMQQPTWEGTLTTTANGYATDTRKIGPIMYPTTTEVHLTPSLSWWEQIMEWWNGLSPVLQAAIVGGAGVLVVYAIKRRK
ncbi:MAG: hypothetical protein ACE5IF_01945 [Candidatus Bathyarchaeia archaeon]